MNGHWECRLSTGGLKSSVFATLPEFFDRSTQPAQLAAHIRETHGCDPEEIVWVVEQKRGRRTRYVDDTTYVKVGDKWEFAMAELPNRLSEEQAPVQRMNRGFLDTQSLQRERPRHRSRCPQVSFRNPPSETRSVSRPRAAGPHRGRCRATGSLPLPARGS